MFSIKIYNASIFGTNIININILKTSNFDTNIYNIIFLPLVLSIKIFLILIF